MNMLSLYIISNDCIYLPRQEEPTQLTKRYFATEVVFWSISRTANRVTPHNSAANVSSDWSVSPFVERQSLSYGTDLNAFEFAVAGGGFVGDYGEFYEVGGAAGGDGETAGDDHGVTGGNIAALQ